MKIIHYSNEDTSHGFRLTGPVTPHHLETIGLIEEWYGPLKIQLWGNLERAHVIYPLKPTAIVSLPVIYFGNLFFPS